MIPDPSRSESIPDLRLPKRLSPLRIVNTDRRIFSHLISATSRICSGDFTAAGPTGFRKRMARRIIPKSFATSKHPLEFHSPQSGDLRAVMTDSGCQESMPATFLCSNRHHLVLSASKLQTQMDIPSNRAGRSDSQLHVDFGQAERERQGGCAQCEGQSHIFGRQVTRSMLPRHGARPRLWPLQVDPNRPPQMSDLNLLLKDRRGRSALPRQLARVAGHGFPGSLE